MHSEFIPTYTVWGSISNENKRFRTTCAAGSMCQDDQNSKQKPDAFWEGCESAWHAFLATDDGVAETTLK